MSPQGVELEFEHVSLGLKMRLLPHLTKTNSFGYSSAVEHLPKHVI